MYTKLMDCKPAKLKKLHGYKIFEVLVCGNAPNTVIVKCHKKVKGTVYEREISICAGHFSISKKYVV